MKKVIVVGAGVAGLSSAVRLAAAGYEVELFEKNSMPGGKMHRISKDGYEYDVGPTLVMMPEIYEDVFRCAGRDPADYIPMHRLEPMYSVYFNRPDHTRYDVSGDLVKLTEMLEGKGAETALGFQRYLADIYARYQVALEYFITRPFRSWKDIYTPKMLNQALKLKTFDSADHMMARYIKDKDIQQMLSFQTLYIGVSPQNGPSLYNIIPMIELLYGVWYIKGGMHTMAQAMAGLLEELNGKIHYNSNVDEIVIENGKAIGVRIGEDIYKSDAVISNVDFPHTIKHLIKDTKAKGKYTDEKIDKMDYSCSCLIFYWGMDKKYEELETHTFIIAEDLDRNLTSIFDGNYIEDASIYLSIPSRGDETLAPEGKDGFYVLMPVSELATAKYDFNDETIEKYRKQAISKVSRLPGCANIANEIVSESVMTPVGFRDKFSAYNGATFGLQPTLRQSNHWRPQAKSRTCEGLYFAGSSIHPGAGVPIVLQSGKIAAEELRRDVPEDSFK